MRETFEFRVPEAHAERFLPADVGVSSGHVRTLVLSVDDPLLEDIKGADKQLRAEGRAFYTAWAARRCYTRTEIGEASIVHVWPKRVFDPAGEECGTTYDDAKACLRCGAGAPQTSPLFLDGRRIPRNADFAQTIAGEIVVSNRVVEVFRAAELTGIDFDAVRLTNLGGRPSDDRFQLRVFGPVVELDSATRAGEGPFDENSYGRCPLGDVVGLNLLSEVTVKEQAILRVDVVSTRQMVGVRQGFLRPRPMLLLSSQGWWAIEEAKLNGLVVEVAHVS